MAVKESGKGLIGKRLSQLAEGQGGLERGRLVVRARWRRNTGTQEEGIREDYARGGFQYLGVNRRGQIWKLCHFLIGWT